MASPDALAPGRPFPADGAMGSALIALGLPAGTAPEAWLLTPAGAAAVGAVHAGHAAAGARIVLTSTFGASSRAPRRRAAAGRTADVCRAAVAIARSRGPAGRARGRRPWADRRAPRPLWRPGPRGREGRLRGAGRCPRRGGRGPALGRDDGRPRRGAGRRRGGAVGRARVPVVATLTFERGRTLFGDRPEDAAAALAALGVAAVGANCGSGFEAVLDVLPGLAAGAPGLPLIAKANAGRPIVAADGAATYPATAADAADYARRAAELGALIVGGCCGTTDGARGRDRRGAREALSARPASGRLGRSTDRRPRIAPQVRP